MENVTDALKMAFAIFIFIFALSLAFSTITKAKEVADIVLWANDKTNNYEYKEYEDTNINENGRIVGIDTVISTIYRCKNETMVVKIIDGSNGKDYPTTFDSSTDAAELTNNINKFVAENITEGKNYLEQFVETKYSGQEITADDGSSIVLKKGATKMYITYTMQ